MKEQKVKQAQEYLRQLKIDGWLIADFHRRNTLANIFLEIPEEKLMTRRYFYWIPAHGEPVRIVHAIEPHSLDAWPGKKRVFLSWQSMREELGAVLKGTHKVAMEYSPKNNNPYISIVDGGTIELVRSFGPEVVSSGEFLSNFTAVFSAKQGEGQIRAGEHLNQIAKDAFHWTGLELKAGRKVTEYDTQQKIMKDFERVGLLPESPPIVAVNAHSADPHYVPAKDKSSPILKGDFLLIDLFAKEKGEGSIYGDICRVGVAAERPSPKQEEVFRIVRKAQKAGIDLVKNRFAKREIVRGFEVDDAVRKVVREAGFEKYFTHRTGHSIDRELHGSGTHIDNLEMCDDRPILPGTCFSVEPGIYLPGDFGIRLESDVYVHLDGKVQVTGGEQDEIYLF